MEIGGRQTDRRSQVTTPARFGGPHQENKDDDQENGNSNCNVCL
jgi:hypothetical protein